MLADLLKSFRKRHGKITQSAAAAAAGISIDTWRKWEQGKYEPDFEQIGRLLKLLGSYGYPLLDRMGIKHAYGPKEPTLDRPKHMDEIKHK